MIKSIEIKNFKSIRSKYFPLRNLNILVGLNGMGKSSFIQSLLCLRISNTELFNSGRFLLNDYKEFNLGSTRDVFYQYSNKANMVLNMVFEENLKLELELEYKPESNFFPIIKFDQFHSNYVLLNERIRNQPLFSSNFQYLNANRIEPKSIHLKDYTKVVENRNLGNKGEFTTHYIEVFFNEDINFNNLIHRSSISEDRDYGEKIVIKTLINQINLWMGEISPNISIRTTAIDTVSIKLEYVYKQPNFGTTNRFRPENVGFGISYVLPVVVALLNAREGELIIIENPESHIHPRGQAELGRLIGLVAMNNVQIIIETHSDHIINGIRVAIKEKELLQDRVSLFYFEKIVEASEQYSKVTNIEFNSSGELSEYPEGLLDEWSNQLLKLI
jgi:predicted ATPase